MTQSAVEQSLRVELAAKDVLIAELWAENAALRVQVTTLTSQVEELTGRVAELLARLNQNPRNSDRPPSSQGYDKPAPRSRREASGRPSGGQVGHRGQALRQVAEPDAVVVHAPPSCSGCGHSLATAPVVSTEKRQVFDLPEIRLVVTEHQVQHRQCRCGQVTMGEVPAGVGGPVQYGPAVRGFATYLVAGQFLPLARTAELLSEVLGAPISQATVHHWTVAAAAGLDPFLEVLTDRLRAAPVLGADETGIRVDGALAWVHTARTEDLTLYTVSTKRGVEAMTTAGVLNALPSTTVLVHDGWKPYWKLPVLHGLCGAHLGRELVAASEVEGQQGWAEPLDRLLREINRTIARARADGGEELAPSLLATYHRRYDALIRAGWAANPGQHRGGRGKHRRPKHVNLLDRLDTQRHEVLRFATDLRVPFTNNGSEQDIRPLKIRMKISGCLRTTAGAQQFCRLRSYLSTARKQGQSAHAVLRALHEGNPWLPAVPAATC